jgi:hypothetical protein
VLKDVFGAYLALFFRLTHSLYLNSILSNVGKVIALSLRQWMMQHISMTALSQEIASLVI